MCGDIAPIIDSSTLVVKLYAGKLYICSYRQQHDSIASLGPTKQLVILLIICHAHTMHDHSLIPRCHVRMAVVWFMWTTFWIPIYFCIHHVHCACLDASWHGGKFKHFGRDMPLTSLVSAICVFHHYRYVLSPTICAFNVTIFSIPVLPY